MAKKEKRDVLVSYDFLPIFKKLIEKNKPLAAAELTVAIISYDKDGTEPSFSDDSIILVWESVIKPKLDANKIKYQKTCEERREAGKNGGNAKAKNTKTGESVANLPNGSKTYQMVANDTNVQKNTKNEKNVANLPDIDIDVDVDIDVDNDGDREKEHDYVVKEKAGGGFSQEAMELAKLWEQRFGLVSSYRMQNIQDLVDEYGKDVAVYAIKEAHQAANSNWPYIKAIARNESMRRQQENKAVSAYPRGRPAGNRKNDAQAGMQRALEILEGDED